MRAGQIQEPDPRKHNCTLRQCCSREHPAPVLTASHRLPSNTTALQFGAELQQSVQQLSPGSEGVDIVFDSVLGRHFDPLYAAILHTYTHTSPSRAARRRPVHALVRYRSLRRGGTAVVFGAASFIKPGFMPNYVYLAIDYLRRPRCDVLEMISQNKGVFGFNLIWCDCVWRQRGVALLFESVRRMWDKMQLMREMLDDMFLRVRLQPDLSICVFLPLIY